MKKILSVLSMFLTTVMFSFITFATDPLDRLKSEMTSKETGDIAFEVMSPALKIAGIVFIILGIILTVGAVGYLSVILVKAIFGKGKLGKSHLGLAGIAMFVGICLIGGAWFGIVKFGKNVGIDPVNDKIIKQQGTSSAPPPVASPKT